MGFIYKITNTINGKFYIGSSVNANSRRKTHFSKLKHLKHDNRHLQSSYNKYGEKAFVFEILESSLDHEFLEERELYYFKLLNPQYNKSTETVRARTGIPLSDEHKKKISIANKGKVDKRTPQQIAAAIEKSKLVTKEMPFKEKMSVAAKVYYSVLTTEEKAARNAYKVGRVFSEETKKKLSERARARVWDEATKKKISEALKGKTKN